MKQIILFAGSLAIASAALPQAGKHIDPPDPVQEAKIAQLLSLRNQAETAYKAGDTNRTIDLLQQVIDLSKEDGISSAAYDLARVFTVAGRKEDALEAFKLFFRWDEKKGDLESGADGYISPVMDYAILLAQTGKAEEAKAIYYRGLRMFNPEGDRSGEPVPFLTVFDQDPEGIYMEYTPKRLEAAALMAKVLRGGYADFATNRSAFRKQGVADVKQLAPGWFYPYMWDATLVSHDPKEAPPKIAAAKARANDQELQLIDRYEIQLAEHIQINIAAETPFEQDLRQMTEGNRRRALMKVLKPNPTILKRLAAG